MEEAKSKKKEEEEKKKVEELKSLKDQVVVEELKDEII